MLFTERSQSEVSLARETRFEAIGRVVKSRVQNTAVATARVTTERGLLFKDRHGAIREAFFKLASDAYSNDPRANHQKIGTTL
jgi:hypothetical protein